MVNSEQLKKIKRALMGSFPSEEELDKYLNSHFPKEDSSKVNGESLQEKMEIKS